MNLRATRTDPLNMSLSDAAAMPATSLPALALLAAMSRSTEGEYSTSCVAGCAAAAASALLWLGLLCSDLAAREAIKAAPLRDTERARSRAAFVMGSMVAVWMSMASLLWCICVYPIAIASAQMVMVQRICYTSLMLRLVR